MTKGTPDHSDDLVREQAYLVARGVRSLAIVGECATDILTMTRTATRMETLSVPGAIPFVLDCKNGAAEYGYAAEPWVIDLLGWIMTTEGNAVPAEHRHRVLGLLLGYSAPAIREYESQTAGRRFADMRVVTGLP